MGEGDEGLAGLHEGRWMVGILLGRVDSTLEIAGGITRPNRGGRHARQRNRNDSIFDQSTDSEVLGSNPERRSDGEDAEGRSSRNLLRRIVSNRARNDGGSYRHTNLRWINIEC